MPNRVEELVDRLHEHALSFPEAWEDHPWGESVAKVGKKVFVFFGTGDKPRAEFGFAVKLPSSGAEARLLPFCEPSGYGLGKSGWVSVKLRASEAGLANLFRRWIEESYRAIAPKRLAAELDLQLESGGQRKATSDGRKAAQTRAQKPVRKTATRRGPSGRSL